MKSAILEETLNKLRGILDITTELDKKGINALLSKHIDHIFYKRVGNHKAQLELNIVNIGQLG
jgi:hypothetical protein